MSPGPPISRGPGARRLPAPSTRTRSGPHRGCAASGVPFFVIDRAYGISGAQPAETFLHALRTAYAGEDAATRR